MHLDKPNKNLIILSSSMEFVWGLMMIFSILILFALVGVWVSGDSSDLEMKWIYSVFGAFVLIWLNWPLLTPTINSKFDRGLNQLLIEKKWIWKAETETIPLDKIKDILVVQKGRIGKARHYFRLELKLDDNSQIKLSSGNYRPKMLVDSRANDLREFLGFVDAEVA